MLVTITTGLSTTVKSAQSKKCRMLKKVREGIMSPKVAVAIRNADTLLAEVMTEEEIQQAADGLKPSRGGGGSIKLTVEV